MATAAATSSIAAATASSSVATPKKPSAAFPTVLGSYQLGDRLGSGAFGTVFMAVDQDSGARVAIKCVPQDPQYRNREYEVHHALLHQNVVPVLNAFTTRMPFRTESGELPLLCLVMELMPSGSLKSVLYEHRRARIYLPVSFVKLFTYQLLRGLAATHAQQVAHRDLKPENLLVNWGTGELKLGDFGSAKVLEHGQPSVSYIGSRFYRAPELCLGATEYSTAIDVWSAGCIMGEMLKGEPLFQGRNGMEQIKAIVAVLGTPTPMDVASMLRTRTPLTFPAVKGTQLSSVCCWSLVSGTAWQDARSPKFLTLGLRRCVGVCQAHSAIGSAGFATQAADLRSAQAHHRGPGTATSVLRGSVERRSDHTAQRSEASRAVQLFRCRYVALARAVRRWSSRTHRFS